MTRYRPVRILLAFLATYGVGVVAWALLLEPGSGAAAFVAGLPDAAWHIAAWYALGLLIAFVWSGAGRLWRWALR